MAQKMRVQSALEAIADTYHSRGVRLEFTDAFIEGFVDDTKESQETRGDRGGRAQPPDLWYNEERIWSGIARHIDDLIYRYFLAGKLVWGAKVILDKKSGEERFHSEITLVAEKGDLFPGSDADEAHNARQEGLNKKDGVSRLRELAGCFSWLQELHERAIQLLKEARNLGVGSLSLGS